MTNRVPTSWILTSSFASSAFQWSIFNVPENKVCFAVVRQLESEAQCEEEKFNGIPWEPERAVEMMQEIKDFKIPHDRTLGDLFNQTPRESISRIYLEDKLYKTWNHDRIVLIGDAAHKVNNLCTTENVRWIIIHPLPLS